MIYHAERFPDIERARARFDVLEARQARNRGHEAIVVTAWLDGLPHVLVMAVSLPPGFLAGATGDVLPHIDPSVWVRLWQHHNNNRRNAHDNRIVVRRDPARGLRL